MGEWITTKIPLELAKQIDSFLNSKEGQIFPNKMQFISEALREKLEKDSSIKPQLDKIEKNLEFLTDKLLYEKTRKKLEKFGYVSPEKNPQDNNYVPYMVRMGRKTRKNRIEKISVHDDRVILKDNIKNRIVEVAVMKGELFCQLCEENDCKHTKFASKMSEVSNLLITKK